MVELQRILGRVLFVMGALAFCCWAYLIVNQLRFQRAATRIFQQQFSMTSVATGETHDQLYATNPVPKRGDIIGHLEIPRINVSVIILEGSDSNTLAVAAGHVIGTALPGALGNAGIAAHRDTFFGALQGIRVNDIIQVSTPAGIFVYQVESTEIVDPKDIQVLQQTANAQLTLITCYPFRYIGSAPQRFIVHARLGN